MSAESSGIRVERTIHVEASGPGKTAFVVGMGYVSKDHSILMDSVPAEGRAMIRRSEDAGATWTVVEEVKTSEPQPDGTVWCRGLPDVFCDPDNGRVLRVYHTHLEQPGVIAWDYARALGARTMKNFWQLSDDEGKTWTEPRQLIMSGPEYDEVHWTDGVWYGKNRAHVMDCHLMKGRNGQVIAPFDGGRLWENGDIVNPNADPATSSPDGAVQWTYGCFFARWPEDGGDPEWSAGESSTLPMKYSCDGGDEPTMAYLPDGRLLVVLRARVFPNTLQELPSLHYYAVSENDGRTWADGEPLLYDDGSYPYAPSCFSKLFRSVKNGRMYVITNFADVPCVNCDPRTKLYIGEIDMETFQLKKDSMTIVDQWDKSAGQPEGIRFSNFRCYEERETGDMMLFMTHATGNDGCPEGYTISPHAYRYRITLPD